MFAIVLAGVAGADDAQEAAQPPAARPEPSPALRTEAVRGWLPGRYRVDRVWYRTVRPSGVAVNDEFPVEVFIPQRKAVAALIVLPMWKGGSLIAERMVAEEVASAGVANERVLRARLADARWWQHRPAQ